MIEKSEMKSGFQSEIYNLQSEMKSGGFGDDARAEATGTDFHTKPSSFFNGCHLLEIGIPDLAGLVIRMTHMMAENRPFPAHFTDFRHSSTPA
jgi:hypothetical protein